jgi:hypothetical protein
MQQLAKDGIKEMGLGELFSIVLLFESSDIHAD